MNSIFCSQTSTSSTQSIRNSSSQIRSILVLMPHWPDNPHHAAFLVEQGSVATAGMKFAGVTTWACAMGTGADFSISVSNAEKVGIQVQPVANPIPAHHQKEPPGENSSHLRPPSVFTSVSRGFPSSSSPALLFLTDSTFHHFIDSQPCSWAVGASPGILGTSFSPPRFTLGRRQEC
jgi:hypothetical protein